MRIRKGTNIQNIIVGITSFFVVLVLLYSCSNIKNLSDDQSILIKNKIIINHKDGYKERRPIVDEIAVIPTQKPNKSILGGVRFKLWLYNKVDSAKTIKWVYNEKDSFTVNKKFNSWLKYKMGEAPVLFDSSTLLHNKGLIENYLTNKGYFYKNVLVSYSTIAKRTTVNYKLNLDAPFTIFNVNFPKPTNDPEGIIADNKKNSYLKFGNAFDIATLKLERDRIADDFRNKGYYDITRENIFFDFDTTYDKKKVNIDVIVNKTDSAAFKVYRIRNIYVYSNYTLNNINKIGYNDTVLFNKMSFITDVEKFRPKQLTEFIFIRSGEKYSQDLFQLTQKRLINLGVFKFTTIEYSVVSTDSSADLLDCFIYLTPAKRQAFSIDYYQSYNISNQQDALSRNRIGSSLNLTYKNKNLSKRADMFGVTLSGDVQFNTARDNNKVRQSVIQSIDAGIVLDYSQNRFLVPFKIKRLSYNSNPKTIFSVGYNFQKRINYFLFHKVTARYGFEWRTKDRIKHVFNILDVSLLGFQNKQPAFLKLLNDRPSARLSFTDGFIPATNYTLIFNGQKNPDDYRFVNNIFGVEVAGNLLHELALLSHINDNDPLPYKILGVKYFQYIKVENDLRLYLVNQDKSALIGRIFIGVGVPYGNVKDLPYVRQYSVGGGNSLRAFRPNVIGPGGSSDSFSRSNAFTSLQLGDMKLELNLEYRFNLYRWFKGAIFADAGNVWNVRKKPELKNAEFNINRFYKEIAIGVGAGIRADFEFFVIRFDLGFPLYDPRYPVNERLVQFSKKPFGTKGYFPANFNLGIGYPF
jgi:hypothetical protein